MMIFKTKDFSKCMFVITLLVVIGSGNTAEPQLPEGVRELEAIFDNCDSVNLKSCTSEKIKEYLTKKIMMQTSTKKYYREYFDVFPRFFNYLNCYVCTVEPNELKRMLAVQFVKSEKDTSKLAGYIKAAVDRIITEGGWGPDFEKIITQKYENARTKQDWPTYYDLASQLAYYSPQWFKYSMVIFHANDTTGKRMKSNVCNALLSRFQDTKDKGVLDTLESLVYAVLQKDQYYFLWFDSFLIRNTTLYKNSKQRKLIYNRMIDKYGKDRNQSGWIATFEYVDSVANYLSQQKILTSYTPPLIIE